MTKETYKSSLQDLQSKFQQDKKILAKTFALSNAVAAVGDIISDYVGCIRIENIQFSLSGDFPQCVYTGIELKKDRTPTKRRSKRSIYQSSIIMA